MHYITAAQDDYGYTLTFNVKHVDLTAFDLTNCTVQFRAKIDSPGYTSIVRNCIIATVPTTGVCAYTVTLGDFTQAGTYNIELVITDPVSVKVVTIQDIALKIHERKT